MFAIKIIAGGQTKILPLRADSLEQARSVAEKLMGTTGIVVDVWSY